MSNPIETLKMQLKEICQDQEEFGGDPEICTKYGIRASIDKLDAIDLIIDALEDPDIEYYFHQIN